LLYIFSVSGKVFYRIFNEETAERATLLADASLSLDNDIESRFERRLPTTN